MGRKDWNSPGTDQKISDAMKDPREQRGPFKKTRANQELTRGEVYAIKLGRKKLRAEMRAKGIKSRKEFELTASSMGLYFDRSKFLAFWLWWLHGRGLAALIGAAIALLTALFLFSLMTQMRGHFTINMSNDMFAEGFSLSEEVTFADPKMRLFCEPAFDVPCFSISDIHDDVDDVDGQHNEAEYFAYTFYIRNEGQSTVGYDWQVDINSESQALSRATWFMIFEDGVMRFYAEAREDGTQEALPSFDDNTRGYRQIPFEADLADIEAQTELVGTRRDREYYRLIPENFLSETVVAAGTVAEVEPMEVHKYTVVIWLEGDDPDCNDDLIGGHLGVDMRFRLISEAEDIDQKDSWFTTNWEMFWDNLVYWEE